MKWIQFKDKLPKLNYNILISVGKLITLITFDKDMQLFLKDGGLDGNAQYFCDLTFYSDDDNEEFCTSLSEDLYWLYPSKLDFPDDNYISKFKKRIVKKS